MDPGQRRSAAAAWQAYNAMESTKQRHFDVLTAIEGKQKKFNLPPTDADQALLARLLRDHDEQVAAFKRAVTELKQRDPDAHRELLAYIGEINTAIHEYRARDAH